MLGRDRQADDGDGEQQGHEQVKQRQFKAGQDDPDDVHHDGQATAGRFFFADFTPERRNGQCGQLETLDAERDADDGDAQDDGADQVADDEIVGLNIPTGVPLVYEFDDRLRPLQHYYLGDPEAIRKATQAVANQLKDHSG